MRAEAIVVPLGTVRPKQRYQAGAIDIVTEFPAHGGYPWINALETSVMGPIQDGLKILCSLAGPWN